jgi:hypothetical protein
MQKTIYSLTSALPQVRTALVDLQFEVTEPCPAGKKKLKSTQTAQIFHEVLVVVHSFLRPSTFELPPVPALPVDGSLLCTQIQVAVSAIDDALMVITADNINSNTDSMTAGILPESIYNLFNLFTTV